MSLFTKFCTISALFSLTGSSLLAQTFSDWKSLIGYWEFKTEKGIYAEEWKSENDSTFTGVGVYRLLTGDTIATENIKVIQESGETFYLAQVSNQNNGEVVRFKLTEREDSQWFFENKSHDFPQGISYSLDSPNLLNAWIEGKQNGDIFRKFFYYERMSLTGKE